MHPLVSGHLGYFQSFTIITKHAAVGLLAQVSASHMCNLFLDYMPRRNIWA